MLFVLGVLCCYFEADHLNGILSRLIISVGEEKADFSPLDYLYVCGF